jgi:hypothetical protein
MITFQCHPAASPVDYRLLPPSPVFLFISTFIQHDNTAMLARFLEQQAVCFLLFLFLPTRELTI